MSRNSNSVSNKNKKGMLFHPNLSKNWILRSEFQRANSGFRISSSKKSYVSIVRQKEQFWFFRPKFGHKLILGLEFRKYKSSIGISYSKIPVVPIYVQLWLFRPKFSQKWILGSEYWKFQIRNHHLQVTMYAGFLDKTENFEFFVLNLEKLHRIFWFLQR